MRLQKFLLLLVSIVTMASCETEEVQSPQVDEQKQATSAKFAYNTVNATVDSLQYNHPLLLDLNNDAQVDYHLTSVLLEQDDRPYLYLLMNRTSPNLNRILVQAGEPFAVGGLWAAGFEKNTSIGETTAPGNVWSFDLTKAFLLNVTDNGLNRAWGGDLIGKKDRYIGLKFKIGDSYHFGWLRVSHNAGEAKLAILDYAYNKEAGKPILAGQK